MTKYRHKLDVIEAVQWYPKKLVSGVIHPIPSDRFFGAEDYTNSGITETELGEYMVYPGDWIIINENGERYCIENDDFEETYEPVESDQKHVCGPYIDVDVVAHRCTKCRKTSIYEINISTDKLKFIGMLEALE